MVTRTERDDAIQFVTADLVDELKNGLTKDQKNLENYIADPTSHVDYNPYVIIDTAYLRQQADYLKENIDRLDVISRYKRGDPEVTLTQHDTAMDNIRSEIWDKLEEIVNDNLTRLSEIFSEKLTFSIGKYETAAGFDTLKYWDDMLLNLSALDGVRGVRGYAQENPSAPAPTPAPPPTEPSAPSAPTGLTGVAPSTAGGTDGKITGANSTMEYQATGAGVWTAVTGSEILGLAAGDYNVRVAANIKMGNNPGNAAVVTVPAPPPAPPPPPPPPPPTGLVGVAPTTPGGTNGKITGANSTMEYQATGAGVWTAVTGSEITGLVFGYYNVRVAANPATGVPAGGTAMVFVPSS